jgi:hypothetical protein
MTGRDFFRTVIVVDTEYNRADDGDRQHVVAVVGNVYGDGELLRTIGLFEDDLEGYPVCPFDDGPDTLFVAFAAQHEWKSWLSLGWKVPTNCVDLFGEAKCRRNYALPYAVRVELGIPGDGLIDACKYFGIAAEDPLDKETMRDRILEGGPFTPDDRRKILDYCGRDVGMTATLWERLRPELHMGQALFRGWFTQAVAAMEDAGIPIDTDTWNRLVTDLPNLRRNLIDRFDTFGLCTPSGLALDAVKFDDLMNLRRTHWPRTRTGRPEMRIKTLQISPEGSSRIRLRRRPSPGAE